MKRLIILVAILSASLSGCHRVHHRLTPPPTEVGRICLTQCAGVREACIANEDRWARFELAECQRRSEQWLRACLFEASLNRDEPARKTCYRKADRCYRSSYTSRCESEYVSCYANCGGSVETFVEKW